MSLSVRKLTNRIGAVIEGVDIAAQPSGEVIAALRGALNEYKVIIFDGVELDDPGQERVASWFGELTAAHPTVPAVPGTTNVLAVDSETSKSNEWHSDVTFVVNPPQVSTLRSILTTPYGGETLIANAAAAYRDLPEPLRDLADSLWAVHTNLVRWSWSPNQLLIFDNRITQHYAIDNYDDWPRRLNRVTVTGDVPTSVDGRRSRQLVGDASHYSRILETAA
jgi:alpha-ketoglutarate-dependent taurine dioxygenase